MARRIARLVALPAGLTLLCCAQVAAPRWLRPEAHLFQPREVIRAAARKTVKLPALPRIVAIDSRIARRVNALRPGVKVRLLKAVAKLPQKVVLLITSAARTRAEQRALHGTFGVKARPGMSAHEDGRALDVNVLVDGDRVSPRRNNKIIGAAMASEGFRYLGAIDPVHYSIPKQQLKDDALHGPEVDPMTLHAMRELEAQTEAAALREPNAIQSAEARVLPETTPYDRG